MDALSRNGDRYSIKTAWKAKKTGTIYPEVRATRGRLSILRITLSYFAATTLSSAPIVL